MTSLRGNIVDLFIYVGLLNMAAKQDELRFLRYDLCGSEKSRFLLDLASGLCLPDRQSTPGRLLGTGVFGDGFRAFRHRMLGQLAGQEEPNGRLDFAARDGGAAVVVRQTTGLGGYPLKNVVHKRIHY